ncbi:hypothetical protein ISS37_03530 [candidate division KSB1 bacterium]|nr:hypothetical protein [candidate division KSB1 bacterium]
MLFERQKPRRFHYQPRSFKEKGEEGKHRIRFRNLRSRKKPRSLWLYLFLLIMLLMLILFLKPSLNPFRARVEKIIIEETDVIK